MPTGRPGRPIPDEAKTEDLLDLIEWLGELVRQVDSSLLDEWEALAAGGGPLSEQDALRPPPSVLLNGRAFRVLVRNELFRRVQLAARRDWASLDELDPDVGWRQSLEPYFDEHDSIGTGPDARGPALLVIEEGPTTWNVRQILADPAGDHDWSVTGEVDLAASAEEGVAVLQVVRVTRLD